jgi:hypothetical protein
VRWKAGKKGETDLKKGLAEVALPQIDDLIAKFEILRRRQQASGLSDWSAIPEDEADEFVTAGMAAIHRIAGPDSQFAIQTEKIIEQYHLWRFAVIPHLCGTLRALRQAVASGYLDNVQELIHASVFADFLEMAEHLLGEEYKDSAAVLIGGVLEGHLRKLCDKNGIPTVIKDSKKLSEKSTGSQTT